MADESEPSEAKAEEAAAPAADPDAGESQESTEPKDAKAAKGRGSRWWYLLLAVLLVEFYVYGSRGEIQVCVGKEGQHDFALLGQTRDDSNRWKFPRCETRENLGLRSNHDVMVEDAAKGACRGQTMLRNRGEGKACLEQADGWSHQVDTRFIPPWDRRYYEHLLWFLY